MYEERGNRTAEENRALLGCLLSEDMREAARNKQEEVGKKMKRMPGCQPITMPIPISAYLTKKISCAHPSLREEAAWSSDHQQQALTYFKRGEQRRCVVVAYRPKQNTSTQTETR